MIMRLDRPIAEIPPPSEPDRDRGSLYSMGKPWNGDYVNATEDLIGDLTHNFFLDTEAHNNKLKVAEEPAREGALAYDRQSSQRSSRPAPRRGKSR